MAENWINESPWSDAALPQKALQSFSHASIDPSVLETAPNHTLDTTPRIFSPDTLLLGGNATDNSSHNEHEVLISQAISLQELVFAIQKVENGRMEHKKIKAENQMLVEYINNMMSATSSTPPAKKA
ncbi:hypothetical protein QVD99_000579 [Batrachochytrium dendrobatidis]|nr:hypothetical protein QVD99_000579 [Batrachochytrium dendrobatidis]